MLLLTTDESNRATYRNFARQFNSIKNDQAIRLLRGVEFDKVVVFIVLK